MSRYTPTFENKGFFEPDLVRAMSDAFEQVCERWKVDKSDHAKCTEIGLGIVELARAGIDDEIGLRDLLFAGAVPSWMHREAHLKQVSGEIISDESPPRKCKSPGVQGGQVTAIR
jgi:hypothetical protein